MISLERLCMKFRKNNTHYMLVTRFRTQVQLITLLSADRGGVPYIEPITDLRSKPRSYPVPPPKAGEHTDLYNGTGAH